VYRRSEKVSIYNKTNGNKVPGYPHGGKGFLWNSKFVPDYTMSQQSYHHHHSWQVFTVKHMVHKQRDM